MKTLFWSCAFALAAVSAALAYWNYNSPGGGITTNYGVSAGGGGSSTSYPAMSVGYANTVGWNSMAIGSGVNVSESNSLGVGGPFTVISAQGGKSPFRVNNNQVLIPAGSCLIIDTPRGGIPNWTP